MPGKVRQLINELVRLRTRGAPTLAHFVNVNLLLSGIDPESYDERSDDDPEKIALLEKMIREFRGRS